MCFNPDNIIIKVQFFEFNIELRRQFYRLTKKRKQPYDLDIPEYQLESLARVLLPIMQEYLASEEGQKDYEEW